jgi:hypothetical protein
VNTHLPGTEARRQNFGHHCDVGCCCLEGVEVGCNAMARGGSRLEVAIDESGDVWFQKDASIKGGWVVIVRGSCECGYKQSSQLQVASYVTESDAVIRQGPSFGQSRAPNSAPAVPTGRRPQPLLVFRERGINCRRVAEAAKLACSR